MAAVGCRDVAVLRPRLQVALLHEAPDLLVVRDDTLLLERGSNAAPAIGLKLAGDRRDGLDSC